ncbi:MAG: type II 3-dehydroquinate dehydratase [Oscillospiraceae bacterium]|nr:type II 3-dehydroquinate dehydratase [Oscillospiraceae bacterium]
MKLLILNGPNINLLGLREPDIYGKKTYEELLTFVKKACADAGVSCECYQSNHEGALVDKIQAAYGVFDGIVFNPAAYTHTSVAIHDALLAVGIPTVEVHLTDTQSREEYRKINYITPCCKATFQGMGFESYARAIRYLADGADT